MASHARRNYKATTNGSAGLNTDFHDAVEAGLPKASDQPSVLRERTSKGLQVVSPKLKRLDTIQTGRKLDNDRLIKIILDNISSEEHINAQGMVSLSEIQSSLKKIGTELDLMVSAFEPHNCLDGAGDNV